MVEALGSDPEFSSYELPHLAELASNDELNEASEIAANIFEECSSGHKIVLLVMTRVVDLVSERTLVLLDEPEAYLHPPLLSAFIRALSELLRRRNAVALVATHSPVVLQEVRRDCVYVLRRLGQDLKIERPKIETFAENVGELTREVFGLDVTESGYHALIREASNHYSFEKVIEYFGGRLGSEGRAIAFSLSIKVQR